jgi:hypothetical protein
MQKLKKGKRSLQKVVVSPLRGNMSCFEPNGLYISGEGKHICRENQGPDREIKRERQRPAMQTFQNHRKERLDAKFVNPAAGKDSKIQEGIAVLYLF